MHIIRYTQFFQLTKNSKSLPFFLFLPNANLNPDFQEHIAFAKISKPRTSDLVRTTNRPQITTRTDWQLRGALLVVVFRTIYHTPVMQPTAIPKPTIPHSSFRHDDIKKHKSSKLLQNNYVHILGNIPYYFSLYFLRHIFAQTKV